MNQKGSQRTNYHAPLPPFLTCATCSLTTEVAKLGKRHRLLLRWIAITKPEKSTVKDKMVLWLIKLEPGNQPFEVSFYYKKLGVSWTIFNKDLESAAVLIYRERKRKKSRVGKRVWKKRLRIWHVKEKNKQQRWWALLDCLLVILFS